MTGWGDFGREVLSRARELVALLPLIAQPAIRLAEAPQGDGGEESIAPRDELAARTTVEAIETGGWEVEGHDAGRYAVRHSFVGSLADVERINAAITRLRREHPSDQVRVILFCEDVSAALGEWPLLDDSLSAEIVSLQQDSGLSATREELAAAVAGLLVVSALPEIASRLYRPGSVGTFGFAGFYGLISAVRSRLAEHVVRAMIEDQVGGKAVSEGTAPEPADVRQFLENFSPAALGFRLFDPRLLDGLRPEPIPAVPTWHEDGTLFVRLDRSKTAAELKRGEEPRWSAQIRCVSRVFDMTLGTLWRRQLEQVAARLALEVREQFAPRLNGILEGLRFGPAWTERLLAELDGRTAAKRSAMGGSSADLDGACAALDAAVAARPNALVLAARMALWVVPALSGGAVILSAAYPPPRAIAFTAGFVTAGLLAAALVMFMRLRKAHTAVIAARNSALDLLLGRQEALLSQNAIGYLDDVLGVLRQEILKARAALERYRTNLGGAAEDLDRVVTDEIHDHPPVSPVISKFGEFDHACRNLGVDYSVWMAEAGRDGLFSGLREDAFDGATWTARFREWCEQRIVRGDGVRTPSYADLWLIRREARGEKDLKTVLSTLWNRAGLWAECANPTRHVLILKPKGIIGELRPPDGVRIPDDSILETTAIPLVCCIQFADLQVLRRARP